MTIKSCAQSRTFVEVLKKFGQFTYKNNSLNIREIILHFNPFVAALYIFNILIIDHLIKNNSLYVCLFTCMDPPAAGSHSAPWHLH